MSRPDAGGDLPVQVVHGDVAASNTLVDERTGEVTGVLGLGASGEQLLSALRPAGC